MESLYHASMHTMEKQCRFVLINANYWEPMQNLDHIKMQEYGNICRFLSHISMQNIGNIGEFRYVHINIDIEKTLQSFITYQCRPSGTYAKSRLHKK